MLRVLTRIHPPGRGGQENERIIMGNAAVVEELAGIDEINAIAAGPVDDAEQPETMPGEAEPETMPGEAEPETMPGEAKPETMPGEAEPETMPGE
jgi:hypothetical protein